MTATLKEMDKVLAKIENHRDSAMEYLAQAARFDIDAGNYLRTHAPEIRAALELKARVDAGWVLVPREPTMEMIAASDEISCRNEGREHWANMLNAAPPAQENNDG